jgi:hypothetical protein
MTVSSQAAALYAYWEAGFTAQYPNVLVVYQPSTNFDPVVALNILVSAYTLVQSMGYPTWGAVHFIERQTGPDQFQSWPVGGSHGTLRTAYAQTIGADHTMKITNGQTCPIVIELGASAATTNVRYTKAIDNCNDWKLGNFGTDDTKSWAEESYRVLYTTPQQFSGLPMEPLTYNP